MKGSNLKAIYRRLFEEEPVQFIQMRTRAQCRCVSIAISAPTVKKPKIRYTDRISC